MLTFTIKYSVEIVFLAITFLLAAMLSSDSLLLSVDYDYSFIVFFASLFMLFLPVFYLATKDF